MLKIKIVWNVGIMKIVFDGEVYKARLKNRLWIALKIIWTNYDKSLSQKLYNNPKLGLSRLVPTNL